MKDLKLWQKAGLVAAIVGGLTLGGLTPKYDSKGLESKLPSIGMSVAEAKTTNPDGYQIPKVIGQPLNSKEYTEDGIKYIAELFDAANGGQVAKLRIGSKIFAYDIDHDKVNPFDYTICDRDGDGIFETKYERGESYTIPDWVK